MKSFLREDPAHASSFDLESHEFDRVLNSRSHQQHAELGPSCRPMLANRRELSSNRALAGSESASLTIEELDAMEQDLVRRENNLRRSLAMLAMEERRVRLWIDEKSRELEELARELNAREAILLHQYSMLGWRDIPSSR